MFEDLWNGMLVCYICLKYLHTVQVIRNITNFSCKKCIRIRTNFVLKFVHEIREKFVHESMPENYVFKEKIWGKYQYH